MLVGNGSGLLGCDRRTLPVLASSPSVRLPDRPLDLLLPREEPRSDEELPLCLSLSWRRRRAVYLLGGVRLRSVEYDRGRPLPADCLLSALLPRGLFRLLDRESLCFLRAAHLEGDLSQLRHGSPHLSMALYLFSKSVKQESAVLGDVATGHQG